MTALTGAERQARYRFRKWAAAMTLRLIRDTVADLRAGKLAHNDAEFAIDVIEIHLRDWAKL